MTTPHKYAEILRAIADGKQIQCYMHRSQRWIDTHEHSVFNAIMLREDHHALQPTDYRIKPEILMINGVECPTPDAVDGLYQSEVVIALRNTNEPTKIHICYYYSQVDALVVFDALCKPFQV